MRFIYRSFKSIALLIWGLWCYSKTGATNGSAYQAMIWLFCISRGKSNDIVSSIHAKRSTKIELSDHHGVLGNMNEQYNSKLVKQLRRDGFIFFPSQLPSEMCDRLMEFAMKTPATLRPMDNENKPSSAQRAYFDPNKPLAVRYDYDTNDLLAQEDVQALLADSSLLTIVQEYLGCQPVADVLSMWWHTDFNEHPDSEAAQLFHFDMDRFKWLKVFIYLTDVGPDNGPHSFVRGTHKSGAIPFDILRRGYVRISDQEVALRYPEADILSFTAPRGSIIIEDTRGLHKGHNLKSESRLILQLQFSNFLFGANCPRAKLNKIVSPKLAALLESSPTIYRQYTQPSEN